MTSLKRVYVADNRIHALGDRYEGITERLMENTEGLKR